MTALASDHLELSARLGSRHRRRHTALPRRAHQMRSEILRVDAPSDPAVSTTELGVRPSDLDPLDHVNNAVYVDWLEEALEAAGWRESTEAMPRSYRLEYLASAARNDRVEVALHGSADAWAATIRRDGADLVRAQGSSAG